MLLVFATLSSSLFLSLLRSSGSQEHATSEASDLFLSFSPNVDLSGSLTSCFSQPISLPRSTKPIIILKTSCTSPAVINTSDELYLSSYKTSCTSPNVIQQQGFSTLCQTVSSWVPSNWTTSLYIRCLHPMVLYTVDKLCSCRLVCLEGFFCFCGVCS